MYSKEKRMDNPKREDSKRRDIVSPKQRQNKMDRLKLIKVMIFVLLLVVIVGCASQGSVPSGPVGGGC